MQGYGGEAKRRCDSAQWALEKAEEERQRL
jgi:hypothetical protein